MPTRRGILIGALAGGGLAVGWLLRPRHFPLPLSPGKGETAFDAWIKIDREGVVTVAVPQLEMGQGITTLIPQIVAEELGADWRLVAVEPAPPSGWYPNLALAARWAELWMPFWPGLADEPDGAITRRWAESELFNVTADGTSFAAYEGPSRAAAASVRAVLAQAAAARWDVKWEECEANNGFVSHGKKRLPFGALAAEAAELDPPGTPVLRAALAHESPTTTKGKLRWPRLDLPSKVDGSHVFAGDVRLPGMLHAAIRHGPIGDNTLSSFDKDGAKGVTGLVGVVKGKRWIAAVARDWWAADRTLGLMEPQWIAHQRADSTKIEAALDKGLHHGEATRLFEAGDPDAMLSGHYTLALRYDVAPALHATLETASATARLSGGKLELWVATQAPEAARRAAAAAVGLTTQDVAIYPMPAGGSFDRRLENDHAVEAAVIAKTIGKPVQLTWSRWQEHLAGWPRTPVSAVLAARVARDDSLAGLKTRIAVPATTREFGRRLFGGQTALSARVDSEGEFDPLAMEGAIPPYQIPHLLVEQVPVAVPLPTAPMRGKAHGYTAFFTESFIDELAAKAKREPLSYRMAMLGGDPRLGECLLRASRLADWNGGNDGSGQGLACHRIGEGRIAVVAIARRDETGVKVDKISAVADIGRIVNLDIARQQIEGGLVFGIGLALGASTDYADGLPLNGRLAALDLPLLADCPAIEVDFIDSEADPADPGELGVAVAAPAIANALFSATGLRFRKLPLLSEEL